MNANRIAERYRVHHAVQGGRNMCGHYGKEEAVKPAPPPTVWAE